MAAKIEVHDLGSLCFLGFKSVTTLEVQGFPSYLGYFKVQEQCQCQWYFIDTVHKALLYHPGTQNIKYRKCECPEAENLNR